MCSGRRTLLDELLTPATVMTVPVQFVCRNWIAVEVDFTQTGTLPRIASCRPSLRYVFTTTAARRRSSPGAAVVAHERWSREGGDDQDHRRRDDELNEGVARLRPGSARAAHASDTRRAWQRGSAREQERDQPRPALRPASLRAPRACNLATAGLDPRT